MLPPWREGHKDRPYNSIFSQLPFDVCGFCRLPALARDEPPRHQGTRRAYLKRLTHWSIGSLIHSKKRAKGPPISHLPVINHQDTNRAHRKRLTHWSIGSLIHSKERANGPSISHLPVMNHQDTKRAHRKRLTHWSIGSLIHSKERANGPSISQLPVMNHQDTKAPRHQESPSQAIEPFVHWIIDSFKRTSQGPFNKSIARDKPPRHEGTKRAHLERLTHWCIGPLIQSRRRAKGPSISQWINDPMSQLKKFWARDIGLRVETLPLDNAPPLC